MISTRIKELRTEAGLTQKELAEKIDSTSKNIWAYENNAAMPPIDVLIRLSDFFECSLDFLVGRSDEFDSAIPSTEEHTQRAKSEWELLRSFRRLSPDLQEVALKTIAFWTKNNF